MGLKHLQGRNSIYTITDAYSSPLTALSQDHLGRPDALGTPMDGRGGIRGSSIPSSSSARVPAQSDSAWREDAAAVQTPTGRGAPRPSSGVTGVKGATPYSSSIPIALTNSNRTTLSQIKARKRIQQSLKSPHEDAPRRIFNYARGGDDEAEQE